MSAPLTIRFATDHSGAKSGIQDLAASVVSNMVKVSDALNTGIQANGGYANTVRTVAANIGSDFGAIGSAGIKAASDSKGSVVAITSAVVGAAAQTKIGAAAATGAMAVTGEAAKFHLGMVRNEVAATAKLLASSPLVVGTATTIGAFLALKVTLDVVMAAARAASEALEETARVGEKATKLDVSTNFFQTYTAQAHNLRVEVDDLVKSLEMAKQAFTVRQGEGGPDARNESSFTARLRQQQEAGNLTAEQVGRFTSAIGTEAQFRTALDLLTELQSKGRELAALDLAAKLFPPEIVERIRAGTIEIDRLRKTMDDVKNPELVLLKPEEITRAQELQRRLDDAKKTLEVAGAQLNRELIRAGERLKEDSISWTEQMAAGARAAVNILRSVRDVGTAYGQGGGLSTGAPPSLASELGGEAGRRASSPRMMPKSAEQQEMEDALNRLRGNLGNRTLIDQAQAASRRMTDGLVGRDQTKPIVSKPTPKSSAESFDAVETFINGLEKTAAAAKAEAEAFGKSNTEKAAAIALAKLKETADQQGITLTDEQIAKTRAAAEATARYRDTLQDLEQAQRQAAELSRFLWSAVADNIGDAVLNGKSFLNVLKDLGSMLARSSLSAIFTGQGPLAGLFGTATSASAGSNAVGGLAGIAQSLLSGFNPIPSFRANGGPVQAGRPYTVGEIGQEIFVPSQDGRIVPVSRGGGGGGGGVNVTVYNNAGDQVQATPQRRSDGGVDFIIDRIDTALAGRVRGGQGALAGVTPGGRQLRG